MTYPLKHFAEGFSRSFLDNSMDKVKKDINETSSATSIDCFFRPIITAIVDTLQIQSIQKRYIEVVNKGKIFKSISNGSKSQSLLIFLVIKTGLNALRSLARDALSSNSRRSINTVHNVMESILSIAAIVVTIASANLAYISSYFLYIGLYHLGTSHSISYEMRSICDYSATILGLASFLI